MLGYQHMTLKEPCERIPGPRAALIRSAAGTKLVHRGGAFQEMRALYGDYARVSRIAAISDFLLIIPAPIDSKIGKIYVSLRPPRAPSSPISPCRVQPTDSPSFSPNKHTAHPPPPPPQTPRPPPPLYPSPKPSQRNRTRNSGKYGLYVSDSGPRKSLLATARRLWQ